MDVDTSGLLKAHETNGQLMVVEGRASVVRTKKPNQYQWRCLNWKHSAKLTGRDREKFSM